MRSEWVGNPVQSVMVEDMLEACKNKDGEGEQQHSQATSIEDMAKFYHNFQKRCPSVDQVKPLCNQMENVKKRATYLLFRAMSTSSFVIWMR